MINDAFQNVTTKIFAAAFLAASALLMASCGGGGATGSPNVGAGVTILPSPGTAYAGVPFTLTVAGGRKPYALGSSEPSIFPVPAITNENILTILPGQPGVVDTGLEPGEVPRRAVVLTARDVNGNVATANFSVLQNFLLGYGVSYQSTCPAPTAGDPPAACNGSETLVTMSPTFNGLLYGNQLVRFERVRGTFGFTQCGSPPPVDPTVVTTITTNTTHNGLAHVCLRPAVGSATQIASYRIIDVNTGVYVDEFFIIVGGAPSGALTVLPPTLSFAGANSTRCGTGSGDVLVFDGTLPYSATSSNAAVTVVPGTSNTEPGRFSITINNQQTPCITDAAVVITDAQGRRATVTVTQTQGPAPSPITATPTAVLLTLCGQSSSVIIAGGTGLYSANSPSALVTATILGNTLTVTRALQANNPVGSAAFPVTVTDGATVVTVTVTAPATCT